MDVIAVLIAFVGGSLFGWGVRGLYSSRQIDAALAELDAAVGRLEKKVR